MELMVRAAVKLKALSGGPEYGSMTSFDSGVYSFSLSSERPA